MIRSYDLWARARKARARRPPTPVPTPTPRTFKLPKVQLPPPRQFVGAAYEVELAMHTRNRHPGRCWVDREHTCAENGTLDHVGIANADGVVVDIYQCSVCHEIWLEPRQFHPHGGPMTLPRPEAA